MKEQHLLIGIPAALFGLYLLKNKSITKQPVSTGGTVTPQTLASSALNQPATTLASGLSNIFTGIVSAGIDFFDKNIISLQKPQPDLSKQISEVGLMSDFDAMPIDLSQSQVADPIFDYSALSADQLNSMSWL